MSFRVGQKVVCVNDRWMDKAFALPVKGSVYTVRDIEVHPSYGTFIRLVEISNPPARFQDGYFEVSFQVEGFRPVVERKTSIAIFQAMLTRPRLGVRV